MISIDQVQYFIEIVKCGSLNKAAKHLFISQPALSKQLNQLEKGLNSTLVVRTINGIELTEEGKFFYERAISIMEMLDDTIHKLKSFEKQNSIRIGGLSNLVTYFIPKYVTKIKNKGNYKISINTEFTNEELLSSLKDNLLDVVFITDAESEEGITIIPLVVEPFYIVFPKTSHLYNNYQINFLDVILNEDLILYKDPCSIRAAIRKQCNQLNLDLNVKLELELTESLISYVEEGHGITILPEIVAKSIQSDSLIIRKIDQIPLYRQIASAIRKEDTPFYVPLLIS